MALHWIRGHEHASLPWNLFVSLFWSAHQLLPHRYAQRGFTRIRYNFCTRADELYHLQTEFDKRQVGEGLVVGYEYSYEAPGDRLPSGRYSDNTKFPRGYI